MVEKARKEISVVWTSGADRGGKITNRDFAWTRGMKEKQREADEVLNGQCQETPEGKNIDFTRIGKSTKWREVWRSLVRASSSAR